MKHINNLIIILLVGLVFTSCEDIIELDLDNTEPRIVIEGVLDVQAESVTVDVTKTNDFYDNGPPTYVSDAKVSITNAAGETMEIPSSTDGSYLINFYTVTSGEEYTLEVIADGTTYTASAIAPSFVPLTGIDTLFTAPPFGGGDFFYQSLFKWEDQENETNYYRVQAIANDTIVGPISLYDDNGLDGQLFVRPLMERLDIGDFVEFNLMSIDVGTYEYLTQLNAVQSQGFGGSTPFNPKGNFDNKALGFFGIRSTSTISIQF